MKITFEGDVDSLRVFIEAPELLEALKDIQRQIDNTTSFSWTLVEKITRKAIARVEVKP